MGIFFRKLATVLFVLLVFTESASAAVTYYWKRGGAGNYGSANAACPNTFVMYGLTFNKNGVLFYTVDSGTCKYRYTNPQNGQHSDELYYSLMRYGDSCPVGNTYDAVIGGCVVPPPPVLAPGELCPDQTGGTASNPMIWDSTAGTGGACVPFSESEGKAPCSYLASSAGESSYLVSGTVHGGYVAAPPTFASTSTDCEIQLVRSSKCIVRVSGQAECVVIGEYSGEVFGGGTDINDALCPDGECPVKEPETTTTEEGCVPVANGSGGTTCTQSKETAEEGTQSCGLVDGAYTCVTKKPYSNTVATTITGASQTLANGSVEVTIVKDSANTICSDVNTCVVKHSVTTTKQTTTSSGGTSSTTSCTGICTPAGGGVETLPTAGSGNSGPGTGGNGNGDGEGEGSEEGNAAIAPSCAAAPFCSGDPFQCAVLKQAHLDTCRLMAAPTAEETAATDAKINTGWAAYDANQATLDAQTSTLYSQFQGAVSGGGGGGVCLADVPFAVMGHSMVMEFSRVCEYIEFIRYGVLAVAYLLAARIVMREDH